MHAIRTVAEDLAFPEGPLELPGGDLVVTEIRTGHVTRIARRHQVRLRPTGGGPNGAALGPDGAIYVAQNGGFEWTRRLCPVSRSWRPACNRPTTSAARSSA